MELIRKRVISDYLEFIHGEGMYTLGFDFSYLRGLSRTEAEKVVDFSHFKVMESIFLCMLDVFPNIGRFLAVKRVSHKKAVINC